MVCGYMTAGVNSSVLFAVIGQTPVQEQKKNIAQNAELKWTKPKPLLKTILVATNVYTNLYALETQIMKGYATLTNETQKMVGSMDKINGGNE